jgi:uncharacterized repeat protein (TIGR01451 family)
VATYNGDSNNASVSSGAASEPVTIIPASPTINTSQQPASATVGTSIADKATVSGGYNPTGTVTFVLYSNPNGTGTPLVTDANVALVNGVATSPGYTATATGTDYWVATYNGDSNNASVSSGAASEPVTIIPASPTINTTPNPTIVMLSSVVPSPLNDTAVLTGGYNPTGTITFTLTYNNAVVYTDHITVSGDSTYTTAQGDHAGGYTLPTTGTVVGAYQWAAVYGGDTNNGSAHEQGGMAEQVTVSPASPTITTTPGVVCAAGNGQFATIGFWHNCNGQAVINGFNGSCSSKTLGNSLASTYPHLFGASNPYTGCSLAGLTNAQVASVYENLWTPGGLTKNTYVQAFAVALGLYSTSGLGTYNLGSNGSAFGYANNTTLPVTQILQYVDSNFTPASGLFYGGDQTNTSCANNVLNGINSSGENPGNCTVVCSGTKLVDSATLAGGYHETGTLTFTLESPSNSVVDTETVTVNGNGTYSTPNGYLPSATGTYHWQVVYNGDGNNNAVTSPYSAEPWKVGAASPTTISTTPNPTCVTLGTTSVILKDTADLEGGSTPTGSITFTLLSPSGTTVDTETVSVNGNGSYTTPGYTLPSTGTVTGTYQWNATYNGDANNSPDSDIGDCLERVTVSPASPTITTTPSATCVTLSTAPVTVKDTATLSGGYYETGSITFTLVAPGGSTVDTETVSVSGNGSYTTSTGYTLPTTVTGTYQWNASYNGDTNNKAVADNGDCNERVVVNGSPNVTVTKTADACTIAAGQTAGYTVTITNIGTATATGVTLSDPLPAGLGKNITWIIDSSKGNPADFTISGSAANQNESLGLSSYFINTLGDSLAAGQSISVHITGVTSAADVASSCTSQCSIPTNFNGTCIPGGDFLWFSCAINVQGLPANQASTITCGGQTISFASGGQNYCLPVANGIITYSPTCTTATTSCDSNGANWISCVPESGLAGNQFLCGLAFQVPQGGLPGGLQNVTWSGNYNSENNCTISTQWAAAAYSCFSAQCSLLGVKPCDDNAASQYKNSDHCGTPEGYKGYVTGGGCGGGGSNYTGSYSGTCSGQGSSCGLGTGTLNNIATVSASNEAACLQNTHAAATIKLTSTTTISGTKFNDLTGNGFSSDDAGQCGVTINLYMESNCSSGLQTGCGGDKLVATTTTASDGTYSFGNLVPGTYYVQEVVPTGYVQTGGGPNGTAGSTYYTISAQSGQTYAGNNFDDYLVPICTPTCVNFTVNNNNCLTKGLTNLSGATQQGDTVTANFTVPTGMSDQLTLVSYIAPGSTFSDSTAYEQVIYQEATGTFAPGTHSLTVEIPNCYYQIDFFCGPAINQLEPNQNNDAYGPDSANILYHAEDRFISSDNGGTTAFSTKSVASGDFAAASYWSTTTGQNLIKSLNGGSSATSLALWLATSFPNLYGSGVGSHCLINSNGSYFNNSLVASAYANFTGGDQQVLSAALSVYATSINLAGTNVHSTDSHFNASLAGSGMDTYNVGTNGSAFGLANSSTLTVMQLLTDLNASTNAGSAVSSGANLVFSGINTIGNVKNASLADVGLAYTPAQIRTAYGINNLSLDGSGQTVAIVDAYDDPAIAQSLDIYDNQFGLTSSGPTLYQQYGPASSFLTVLNQNGQMSSLPATDPNGPGTSNWEVEEALDVEWVHAMAPGAQIILVEANSQSLSDLMASVVTAANQPGVSVVSMSWGFAEGQSVLAQDEALYDGDFTTPAGHQGVTFVASTGDYGTADPEYPAFSPNVVAVGGTSLYLNADNSYNNETGWGYFSNSAGMLIGSGGGTSLYEPEPTYQLGVQSTGSRSTPDVSFVADPGTGAWISDPYNLSADSSFEVVGGTSLSSPCWAGMLALVNQGRTAAGQPTLNSTTPTDAQQALYSLPQTDFNSITSGSNGGYTAQSGYNMVTGLGTPVANRLVPDLVAYQQSGDSNTTTPISVTNVASYGTTATGAANALGVMNVFNALTVTANSTLTAYPVAAASPADVSAARANPLSSSSDLATSGGGPLGCTGACKTAGNLSPAQQGINLAAQDYLFSQSQQQGVWEDVPADVTDRGSGNALALGAALSEESMARLADRAITDWLVSQDSDDGSGAELLDTARLMGDSLAQQQSQMGDEAGAVGGSTGGTEGDS